MLRNLLLFYFVVVVMACSSAKLKVVNEEKASHLRSLALIPVDYPTGVQREKVDAIVKAVEFELRNAGFIVLADRLVRERCSSPQCIERIELARQFPVDGFVSVGIESITRSNFIAGFYNAIRGNLQVSDEGTQPILEVKHTQSERGGLLFNTGQILQAFISYKRNLEAESEEKLASGFAQALVSKVPTPKADGLPRQESSLEIEDVEIRQVKPEIFEVCAYASPGVLLSVYLNRLKTDLRPVKDNKYCGTFLYNQASSGMTKLTVEARSPFGSSVYKEASFAKDSMVCDLNDNVLLGEKNGRPVIQLACLENKDSEVCKNKMLACKNHKFVVFRAPSSIGPYKKIAEFRNSSWIDTGLKAGQPAYYELVSVNKAGAWSLPVAPKPLSKVDKG